MASLKKFLPAMSFNRSMDMEFGPDGALYVLEWGTNYMGDNQDAQLVRIDYLSCGAATQKSDQPIRQASSF